LGEFHELPEKRLPTKAHLQADAVWRTEKLQHQEQKEKCGLRLFCGVLGPQRGIVLLCRGLLMFIHN